MSVLIVKFSIEDGKSHWMSGVVLIGMSPYELECPQPLTTEAGVYVVIALSFWDYPMAQNTLPATLICV